MWLKIIGGMMILSAGAWAGFAIAGRFNERPRQISQLIGGLAALQAYVNYIGMPLPEALRRCGLQIEKPVSELFRTVGGILDDCGWLSPRQAVEKALDELKRTLAFAGPETELLLQLGANLGQTNRDEQQKYLAMVAAELGRIEQEAKRDRDRNATMYRYLGVCSGLAAVILLA